MRFYTALLGAKLQPLAIAMDTSFTVTGQISTLVYTPNGQELVTGTFDLGSRWIYYKIS